ncbi:MAG: hypothetical protein U0271_07410 [Polyangiaceae bacterium]
MRQLARVLCSLFVALSLFALASPAHADDDEVPRKPNVDQVTPVQFDVGGGIALDPEHGAHFAGNVRFGIKFRIASEELFGVWLSPTASWQFGLLNTEWSYHQGAFGLTAHVGNRWSMFTASALGSVGAAIWANHPDKATIFGGAYGVGGQFFYELIGLRVEHELLYFADPVVTRSGATGREQGFDQQLGLYLTLNVVSVVRLIFFTPDFTE